ncbi:MAG: hypothetical protein C5B53_10535 [Candidatus Melainabacteria bacterium]|nr:MAG: hypothetical protein C5B53_10535 [Candidatus Melainabacteria bacterium]
MILYKLTYYPDGLDAERINTDEIEQTVLSPFERLFESSCSFTGTLPDKNSPVDVKWTGFPEGQSLLTCSIKNVPFLSGAFVVGKSEEADKVTLQMFIDSLSRTQIAQEMVRMGRVPPFHKMLERKERPLLLSAIWPTLPPEKFAEFAGLDILMCTAYLRRLEFPQTCS